MKVRFPDIAFFVVLLACAGAMHSSPSAEALLGSPDVKPSVERPFGFRGDGSGRFPGATPPLAWSLKKNVRWSTVVGRSHSSPIITGKFAFVTSEPGVLICLDRADGRVLWKSQMNPNDLADEKSRKMAAGYEAAPAGSGMAAATPVTDGKNVYTYFANGIVRAVDLEGKLQWTAFIDAEQITSYGRSSSPIIVGGKLIVHMTNLYAFDLATGRQLWVNTEAKSRYGTPTGFKMGALDLIVTPAGDLVRADDGKGVGSSIGSSFYSSPVVADDGVIYFGEKEVKAARLSPVFKDEEIWSGNFEGDVFGSPLLHNGLLFTASSKCELIVYSTTAKGSTDPIFPPRSLLGDGDGEGPGGQPIVYASVTLAGNHLFLTTTTGDTIVLEATLEAKQVARNTLNQGTGSSPVFSGKDIYLRDGDKLFCIGEE